MSDEKLPEGTPAFQNLVAANKLTSDVMENNRRSHARGAAIQARGDSLELMAKNKSLMEEIDSLRQQNQLLLEQSQAASKVALVQYTDAQALRKSVRFLESSWQNENETSPGLAEASKMLDDVHREAYATIWKEPDTSNKVQAAIKAQIEKMRKVK